MNFTEFRKLNFINSSGNLAPLRLYILALLIVASCINYTASNSLGPITMSLLWGLASINIPLHMLVCSMVGMDQFYVLHLIIHGLTMIVKTTSIIILKPPTIVLIQESMHLLVWIIFLLFNVRTRILYLSTFRMAVRGAGISSKTLFKKIFQWWLALAFMVILLTIFSYTIFKETHYALFCQSCALPLFFSLFELKLYLSLISTTDRFDYLFSRQTYLLEKFYLFCSLYYLILWCVGIAFDRKEYTDGKTLCGVLRIIGYGLRTIQWIWLLHYAKEKLQEFLFQCIDDPSSSSFDEFEIARSTMEEFERWSLSQYEP